MNPFQILEISEDFTTESLKKAYRAKAKIYHPDSNHPQANSTKFDELNKAYEFLQEELNKPKKPEKGKGKKPKERIVNKEIVLEFNLISVYNGIDETFTLKVDDTFSEIPLKESPRDITRISKHRRTAALLNDGRVTTLFIKHIIHPVSSYGFSITRDGMNVTIKVTEKSDAPFLRTPLNGINITNSAPYSYTLKNRGLYMHLEESTLCGDLVIDNTINEPVIQNVVKETHNRLFWFEFERNTVLTYFFLIAFLYWLITQFTIF